MRVELREFHEVTNLLVFPETEEEKHQFDQVGKLDIPMVATLRLSDGWGEYYLLVEGQRK